MKKGLELKIAEEFPFMRRGRNIDEQRKEDGRISDLYGAFGCSIIIFRECEALLFA